MESQEGKHVNVSPPSDLARIQTLIQDMGVTEFEPRVLSLLHDFAFKYVSEVLTDAEVFAEHAMKPAGVVEMDDVMHAIQARAASAFVPPPSLDSLSESAKRTNQKEMPKFPSQKHGLLIPEDKECLTTQSVHLLPS